MKTRILIVIQYAIMVSIVWSDTVKTYFKWGFTAIMIVNLMWFIEIQVQKVRIEERTMRRK